jgi:hypothetical protein
MRSSNSGMPAELLSAGNGKLEHHNPEPWLDPQRRQTLLRMHEQLASIWTKQMHPALRPGHQFTFCGFCFESAARCAELRSEGGHSIVFSFENSAVVAAIAMNTELAAYLLENQLGRDNNHPKSQVQRRGEATSAHQQQFSDTSIVLTRVETALLRMSLASMLDKLGVVYSAAGVGVPETIDPAGSIETSFGLRPDGQLMVFRYNIGGQSDRSLNLAVAATESLAGAVHDTPRESEPMDENVLLAVAAAHLDVKLVLGNWNATIEELSSLKSGHEIILQDGTDAWLTAGGIPVKPVQIKLNNGRIMIESRKVSDGRK